MLRISKALCAGLLIGFVGVMVGFLRPAHDVEENVDLGLLFKLRGVRQPPAEVVVVSIDRESAEQLNVSGNPSRWPRSLHADLVKKLTHAGARLILFDLYFIEARSAAEDDAFAAVLSQSGNVILAEAVRARDLTSSTGPAVAPVEYRLAKTEKPIDLFARAAVATAPFVLPRLPVRVNRYWTFQPSLGQMSTSPVVAFQLYALPFYADFRRLLLEVNPVGGQGLPENASHKIQAVGLSQFIKDIRTRLISGKGSVLGRIRQALEQSTLLKSDLQRYRALKSYIELYYGENYRYLNFYGPARTIRTIPFHRALFSDQDNLSARIDFKDKVVFVGLSETLLTEHEDSFHTVFSDNKGTFISGVEVLATAFANLIENSSITPLQPSYYLLLIFSWGMLIGFICFNFRPVLATAAVLAASATYLTVGEHLFAAKAVWMPVAIPLFMQVPLGYFGMILWTYAEVKQERENFRKALRSWVPDDVVQELAQNVVNLKKGNEVIHAVCLFTDIADYTHVSETLAEQTLHELMERYFAVALEPIRRNGGVIIDAFGDSVFAIWEAPELNAHVRRQACNAAIELANAVRRFNENNGSIQLPTRIGIHAGPISVRHFSGSYYRDARGDTVNTASRIDTLNKLLGTEILVSEEVMHAMGGYLAREGGQFLLKGKRHPVLVYEFLGELHEASESQKKACELFARGLEAFRTRSWNDAENELFKAFEASDRKGLTWFYLERCKEFKINPPPESWDGTFTVRDSVSTEYAVRPGYATVELIEHPG